MAWGKCTTWMNADGRDTGTHYFISFPSWRSRSMFRSRTQRSTLLPQFFSLT